MFARKLLPLAVVLAFPLTASAWVGGPFSNDSPLESGTDGTYRASISGKNLVGVTSFISDASGQSNGRFAIFHEGVAYQGSTDAILDSEARRITAVFGAQSNSGFPTTVTTSSGNFTATLRGQFTASYRSNGPHFTFSGKGQVQTPLNGTVPTYDTVVDGFITTVLGDPIEPFTKIWVRGTRTSTEIVTTTFTRP